MAVFINILAGKPGTTYLIACFHYFPLTITGG
jgi:hypothetical protein